MNFLKIYDTKGNLFSVIRERYNSIMICPKGGVLVFEYLSEPTEEDKIKVKQIKQKVLAYIKDIDEEFECDRGRKDKYFNDIFNNIKYIYGEILGHGYQKCKTYLGHSHISITGLLKIYALSNEIR